MPAIINGTPAHRPFVPGPRTRAIINLLKPVVGPGTTCEPDRYFFKGHAVIDGVWHYKLAFPKNDPKKRKAFYAPTADCRPWEYETEYGPFKLTVHDNRYYGFGDRVRLVLNDGTDDFEVNVTQDREGGNWEEPVIRVRRYELTPDEAYRYARALKAVAALAEAEVAYLRKRTAAEKRRKKG